MKWPEHKLSKLADRFISGGTPSTKVQEFWQGDIPWITGADFSDGEVLLGRRYINQLGVNNSATNIVPKGSLLMVTRTGVGKIAIAPVDLAISQDITGIVLKSGLSVDFVIAAIRNRMGVVLAAQRGATIKGVTRKDIENLTIPSPAISEQRRIVEILDQANTLRKKRAEADVKASRILSTLFFKSFGNPLTNPRGWEEASLDSRCDIVTGNTPSTKKPEYYGDQIPWARPSDLNGQLLVTNTDKMLSEEGRDVARIVPTKSVLVVCIGATLGKVALAGVEMAVNQQINAARPSEDLLPEFLYVQCSLLADRFRTSATKSTLPILNKSQFAKQKFICPPKDEQETFVSAASLLISSHTVRVASGQKLEILLHCLLHRAFTGGLTAKWRETHMKELLAEMEQQTDYLEMVK